MLIFLILSYGAIRLRRTEPDLAPALQDALLSLAGDPHHRSQWRALGAVVVSDWRTGIYSLLSLALALPLYALGLARWRPMSA